MQRVPDRSGYPTFRNIHETDETMVLGLGIQPLRRILRDGFRRYYRAQARGRKDRQFASRERDDPQGGTPPHQKQHGHDPELADHPGGSARKSGDEIDITGCGEPRAEHGSFIRQIIPFRKRRIGIDQELPSFPHRRNRRLFPA